MITRGALDIHCPRCGSRAAFDEPFEFHSKPPADADRAADGRPVHRWGGWYVRERFHVLYPWRPPRTSEQSLVRTSLVWGDQQRLPPGAYRLYHRGVVRCSACHLVARHRLVWAADAYFQWDVRGARLWAEDVHHARVLLDYVQSAQRDSRAYGGYARSLELLPAPVLAARNRDLVVRRIRRTLHDAALSETPVPRRRRTGWPEFVATDRPVRRSR